jgi:hypothetical protein
MASSDEAAKMYIDKCQVALIVRSSSLIKREQLCLRTLPLIGIHDGAYQTHMSVPEA